jgi:ring-1,2-phenylacetyl-CoA epoxidase subunit PaaC
MEKLQLSNDKTLQAIANKTIKEVSYHERFSSDWVKRLGDGTDESNMKMQEAINGLWRYTDELFHLTDADRGMVSEGVGVDVSLLKEAYYQRVSAILKEAMLEVPESKYFQKGGKEGIHTEHMGYILSDLQYMQRAYPNMKW